MDRWAVVPDGELAAPVTHRLSPEPPVFRFGFEERKDGTGRGATQESRRYTHSIFVPESKISGANARKDRTTSAETKVAEESTLGGSGHGSLGVDLAAGRHSWGPGLGWVASRVSLGSPPCWLCFQAVFLLLIKQLEGREVRFPRSSSRGVENAFGRVAGLAQSQLW